MSDGRYTFTPLSAQQQEGLEQAALDGAGAAEDVEEVRGAVVRHASDDGRYVLLMAFDYSDEAAASPELWESFQMGVSQAIGAEMEEASVGGADAAYQKAPDLHTLLIRYGPDLVFSLSSPRDVSRPELEDVARYLLRDRH
ncbi:MAG TPA: hypothetical protein VG318_10555 [Actinomycetota bacterium]|nr:hypothetical protein [Actinomycetota bacterium]